MKFSIALTALTLGLTGALIAQDAPPAPQPSDFKGVVRKNKVPVSNDVLRVKFAKPTESKLKNGMTLLVIEDHRSPTVTAQVAMPGSNLNEPVDRPNVLSAMTALMRLGTASRTALQIAQQEAELGTNIGIGSGDRNYILSIGSLTENFDASLDLATDILFHPSFPREELDKWKDRQIAALAQARTQSALLASERFQGLMYPDDIRGRPLPTADQYRRITREMLLEEYAKAFKPDGGYVAVTGDITLRQAAAKFDNVFANFKGAGIKPPDLPLRAPIETRKVILVDRPGSVQTDLLVGNRAIDRRNPDFVSVQVLNRILGSGPASRLFRNIREDKGYTYGISSAFSAGWYANVFQASTSVRTEVTGPALQELLKEFADIRDRAVPEEELALARRALSAAFALSTESQTTALNNALTIRQYGFPADYWDTYPEKIAAVTAADVQRVARKYIPVDNAQIVAVGDAARIREVLAKFGPVEEWDADGHKK
jgi:zinc protease